MDRTNREDDATYDEYGRRDIDQVQPGEAPAEPAVEPARDIDQVQPGETYTGTTPGTEPLTSDLDTGHIGHEHIHEADTQPPLPVDRSQTTRPLTSSSPQTRVLPQQPDTAPGTTTATGGEGEFAPYVPENDNTD